MNNKYVINTLDLYKELGWKSYFAKIRFWDAPLIELEKLIPKKGSILDLGCGDGIFANFLALTSPSRRVYGIEVNKNRIKDADRRVKNTKFVYGDITSKKIPPADAIILIHVLHHLDSLESQNKLLKKIKPKLKKNGQLIIAEIEPKLSEKFLITWFTDHFLVPWIFEKKLYSPIFFRKSGEWNQLLKELGFQCEIIPMEKGKPFSHVTLVCKKIK